MRNSVWRIDGNGANAVEGSVVWAPFKSIWNMTMYAVAIVLGPLCFSWSAFALFLGIAYVTLLLGHSLGMHRRLIHRSFECGKPLERFLVWLGVLVGMSGPFGILEIHDVRDWAQRERNCHDFFAHRRGLWIDAFWQLNCKFSFRKPPRFLVEPELSRDPWYRFMELTWPIHQGVLAAILYSIGGLSWAVWGVAVRVAVSVTSHWIVTYFAHNPGPGRWRVKDTAVQASNLAGWGFLTHGECWHNNHHAFPESARMGLEPWQSDPGYQLLLVLQRCGWVGTIGLPRSSDRCEDLEPQFGTESAIRGEGRGRTRLREVVALCVAASEPSVRVSYQLKGPAAFLSAKMTRRLIGHTIAFAEDPTVNRLSIAIDARRITGLPAFCIAVARRNRFAILVALLAAPLAVAFENIREAFDVA